MYDVRSATVPTLVPLTTPRSPRPRPAEVPAMRRGGLYVHVPFCFHKCHYCDFYSITRQTPDRMKAFVDRILAEANLWGGQVLRPRTVFFGGGTPSLLPLEEMRRMIAGLRGRFDLSQVAEWTVEVNPATADGDYLAMLRSAGVDRISFGAQSFDPGDLKRLERHHDPDDVPRSLDLARAAGFGRLSLDLIYAVPGQSLASWARTLETALSLGTSHLSCYGLTYEPNTPLAVLKRLGRVAAATDELELEMLRHTRSRLAAAGMPAYEVSNYAGPGQESLHNLNYWTGDDYLALGPSGASHAAGTRWKNAPHLGDWERAVDAGDLPAVEVEVLPPAVRAGELAMLRLRLADGMDLADFAARTGVDPLVRFAPQIDQLARAGLLELTPTHLRLTDAALPVTDAVAAEFL